MRTIRTMSIFVSAALALFLLAALVFAGTATSEVSRDGLVGEWYF